ncbi:tRNA-modifying protein YgfZ [Rahnella sikkimica]|uniref:tRNA-modifying protein YgfZ n=1 Tax=Rahnella sikkimica TaxID=1805933 RepID=A0A2L1UWA4_9GAMM|nr:tRNA-modifying protein YgfZ [Rahnella sikkimica]AVF37181.1 tRNA-modifying protein YgfZ [Rahnella sikkimica]
MANAFPFPPQKPSASSHLPLTLISLEDWALVTMTGADTVKYLQGQVTADIDALPVDHHILCAHCDAKGKMWSNLRLFTRGDGMAYIERRNLRDTQLNEIKKYAVFSKITFTADDDVVLLGVAGFQASAALTGLFSTLPTAEQPVVQQDETTLLHFSLPAERFLIVTSPEKARQVVEELGEQAQRNDSQQWLALDIEAGFPVIDTANTAQFIPQATNIQALDGISFTKGCYAGQEMVARAKYRGANKRALYWLSGKASKVPAPADDLELQLGENWRRTGTVLAAVQLSDGTVWVQAVLNNDLDADANLRVRDDTTSHLSIQPLPYSLEETK